MNRICVGISIIFMVLIGGTIALSTFQKPTKIVIEIQRNTPVETFDEEIFLPERGPEKNPADVLNHSSTQQEEIPETPVIDGSSEDEIFLPEEGKEENPKTVLNMPVVYFVFTELGPQETLTEKIITTFSSDVSLAFIPEGLLLSKQIRKAQDYGFFTLADFTYSSRHDAYSRKVTLQKFGFQAGLNMRAEKDTKVDSYTILGEQQIEITSPFTPTHIRQTLSEISHQTQIVLVPALPVTITEVQKFMEENNNRFSFQTLNERILNE